MSERRPHEPVGTFVDIIRHSHGWHDGMISGTIIKIEGFSAIIRLQKEDGGGEVECEHRRDYSFPR